MGAMKTRQERRKLAIVARRVFETIPDLDGKMCRW